MSCGNKIWSGHHPLRRQKSSIEVLLPNKMRERKLTVLQKQLSVDATSNLKQQLSTTTITKEKCETNVNGHVWKDDRPESSLRILAAVKKRSQGNGKNEQDLTERLKKAFKDRGNRFNLNIFLGHSTNPQEQPDSDLGSSSESITNPNKDVNQTDNVIQLKKNIVTNVTKRTTINGTFEHRPPLLRAMSAPIRPIAVIGQHQLDDPSKILQGRKKLRRKKSAIRERDDILESSTFDREEEIDDELCLDDKSLNKLKNKKNMPRARSAIGCDIVTLVSLLSSSGSDSEKEENPTTNTNETNKIRTPMLRKTGKSVSFQEKDNMQNNSTTPKELSTMFRRNSIAPFRANRPPTAPVGSTYLSSFENSEGQLISKETKLTIMEKKILLEPSVEDENLPENVRSPKEKECWKLFQKMAKRGVACSYDTILRGMLTPSELRIIQKQKEAEQEKLAEEEKEVKQ